MWSESLLFVLPVTKKTKNPKHGSGQVRSRATNKTAHSFARNAVRLFMLQKLQTPLKTHGGKSYLAKWILDFFPKKYQELKYIELFAGGASLLFTKEPSTQEILNDLDHPTYCVWKAIRDNKNFGEVLSKFQYTKETFQAALLATPTDELDIAIREYILRRMSRGGMRKSFAWSDRLRGGIPGDVNAWNNSIASLSRVSDRLQNVEILNYNFKDIFLNFGEDFLIYLDPPYLKKTRAKNCDQVYSHEMTNVEHIDLLKLCLQSKAKIVLSGYPSELYQELLGDWKFRTLAIANHASQSKKKKYKTECIWTNF